MHLLKALEGLESEAREKRAKLVAPGLIHLYVGEFVYQIGMMLSQMRADSQQAKKTQEIHPIVDRFSHWMDLRLRPLVTDTESVDNWDQATFALRWIETNAGAIRSLLMKEGDLDENEYDDDPGYGERKPMETDAPLAGGGRLPIIWNAASGPLIAGGMPMPTWNAATHRSLFLSKLGKASGRARMLTENGGLVRAFVVRMMNGPVMTVEYVGFCGPAGRQQDMLGVAHYLVNAANDITDEMAEPLLIELKTPGR